MFLNLVSKLKSQKWLITQQAFEELAANVNLLQSNPSLVKPQTGEIDFGADADTTNSPGDGLTAFILVNGILSKEADDFSQLFLGLCNTDDISAAIDNAESDPSVKDLCFIFNSPGGESTGIEELGRKIAGCTKLTRAWTETQACSAAYWLASQADVIGTSPTGTVGSIGVYSVVDDYSEALKAGGVNKQAIYSGKFKLLGANFKPLSDEEWKIIQDDVDAQHEKFKQAVLSKRPGIDASHFEGLTYEGNTALQGKLVDTVTDSLNEFLSTTNLQNNNENLMNVKTLKLKLFGSGNKQETIPTATAPATTTPPAVPKQETTPATPPVETPAATKEMSEVPGVPGTKEESGHYDGTYAECPSCKHVYALSEDHLLTRMASEDEDDESGKEEKTDEPAGAKKEETAPIVDKHMDAEAWKKATGTFIPKPTNAFLEACGSYRAQNKI